MKITAEISNTTMKMVIEHNGTTVERIWERKSRMLRMSVGEKHINDLTDDEDVINAVSNAEDALTDIMDVI